MVRRRISKTDVPPISELISLEGKRALITGSAAGIGKAMTYRFAEAGADLELVDLSEGSLQHVTKNVTQHAFT